MASSSRIRSVEEEGGENSPERKKAKGSNYVRHNHDQIAKLEELFKQQPTPDENQRYQIAQDLGLTPKQVKFWFQNKRTQKKIKKAHKLVETYIEKPESVSELQLDLTLRIGCSHDPSPAIFPNSSEVQSLSPNPGPASDKNTMPKAQMISAVIAAKEELVRLLSTNEPLWIKSPTDDRRLILHPICYESFFPRVSPLIKSSKAREESSKGSGIVGINTRRLIDMIMNSETWTHLFPTIVSKAHTIQVIEKGSFENRSGAILLMYMDMHVLSPSVPSREFYFLRYCAQIENGIWVITDVSLDYLEDEKTIPSSCWRFPSGCLIREMPNAFTEVTWVEHVEVDENISPHSLYKDVVSTGIAYGAERWLSELSRMCHRLSSFVPNYIPCDDSGAVISVPEGRKSLIKLSHRMMKNFTEMLSMSKKSSQQIIMSEGIWISVKENIKHGHENAKSLVVATSFWVPNPSNDVVNFFIGAEKRAKWDFHSTENNPLLELCRISNRPHSANFISVFQETKPAVPRERGLIIQEIFMTPLGSYIVYSPINVDDLSMTVRGHDSSKVFVLPSGITISELPESTVQEASSSSGNHGATRGSLVTVALQIEISAAINSDSVDAAKALVISTMLKIKDGLNFYDLV
ncbi:PREDICTED: homeobox-leucine zipper protein HDG11-like [Lupinus angustifolius]|uniref:homeobox-leucine zipper protein HDG11-like n=1 Tax=Lupinus angustifolius TaxID=3871 RepID=UPI00092E5199|nr:PREDICTED: homeobox-leucine zipper protein HDG11-like [Lupinus angustifolius]